MHSRTVLILGGARSGKSRYAQQMAERLSSDVVFVATAEALDEEMSFRIGKHRRERPSSWRTIEAPVDVAGRVTKSGLCPDVVVIDCLTLLVSNVMSSKDESVEAAEAAAVAETDAILRLASHGRSTYIVVSNEVGLGLVPDNPLGRAFRDILGRVNQVVAGSADEVYFMTAGLPLKIKG